MRNLLFLVFAVSALKYQIVFSHQEKHHIKFQISSFPPFKDKGELCEHIAASKLANRYHRKSYAIVRNVFYRYKTVIRGELDLVVLRKKDNKAVFIAEVKCQKNYKRAFFKAMSQLNRFKNAIRKSGKIRAIHSKNRRFKLNQFQSKIRYEVIQQKIFPELIHHPSIFDLGLTMNEIQDFMQFSTQ